MAAILGRVMYKKIGMAVMFLASLLTACLPSDVPSTPTPLSVSFFPTTDMGKIEADATQTAMAFNPKDESRDILNIFLSYDRKVGFSKNDLEELPSISMLIGGREYKGVRFADVLKEAGWLHYDVFSVTIDGVGSLTLSVHQLPDDAALMFNDHGMVDFVSLELSPDDLPKDVVLIYLK